MSIARRQHHISRRAQHRSLSRAGVEAGSVGKEAGQDDLVDVELASGYGSTTLYTSQWLWSLRDNTWVGGARCYDKWCRYRVPEGEYVVWTLTWVPNHSFAELELTRAKAYKTYIEKIDGEEITRHNVLTPTETIAKMLLPTSPENGELIDSRDPLVTEILENPETPESLRDFIKSHIKTPKYREPVKPPSWKPYPAMEIERTRKYMLEKTAEKTVRI